MDRYNLSEEIDAILEQERKKTAVRSAETAEWQTRVREPLFHSVSKNHNVYYGRLNELSKKMRNTLVSKLLERKHKHNTATERALHKRELLIDGQLSEDGELLAIASAGLKTQCEVIGAEYIAENIQIGTSVEESVLAYFRACRWSGLFSEGQAIFELLHAISYESLKRIAKDAFKEIDKQSYEILHAPIFSDYSDDVKEELAFRIREISDKELLDSFRRLRRIKKKTSFNLGYGVLEFDGQSPHETRYEGREIVALYRDFPKQTLLELAFLCMSG